MMAESTEAHTTTFVINPTQVAKVLQQDNPTFSSTIIDAVTVAMIGSGTAVAEAASQLAQAPDSSSGLRRRSANPVRFRPEVEAFSEIETEEVQGEGLGDILPSSEEGMARLREVALEVPLEEWAGDLATPTDLIGYLGVARSTINSWRERGDVIALPKGKRAHVYPLLQFKEGRPIKAIGEILSLTSGNALVAWRWLTTPSVDFEGETPIKTLREGDSASVLDAVRRHFG